MPQMSKIDYSLIDIVETPPLGPRIVDRAILYVDKEDDTKGEDNRFGVEEEVVHTPKRRRSHDYRVTSRRNTSSTPFRRP